jgi:hypothetical protein
MFRKNLDIYFFSFTTWHNYIGAQTLDVYFARSIMETSMWLVNLEDKPARCEMSMPTLDRKSIFYSLLLPLVDII